MATILQLFDFRSCFVNGRVIFDVSFPTGRELNAGDENTQGHANRPRASLAYFHPRRFAGRYRRKRRHSAAPDDPVLMFSRERPARSTAPSVLTHCVEMPPLFQNGRLLFFFSWR